MSTRRWRRARTLTRLCERRAKPNRPTTPRAPRNSFCGVSKFSMARQARRTTAVVDDPPVAAILIARSGARKRNPPGDACAGTVGAGVATRSPPPSGMASPRSVHSADQPSCLRHPAISSDCATLVAIPLHCVYHLTLDHIPPITRNSNTHATLTHTNMCVATKVVHEFQLHSPPSGARPRIDGHGYGKPWSSHNGMCSPPSSPIEQSGDNDETVA